jgi:hypothetical protein
MKIIQITADFVELETNLAYFGQEICLDNQVIGIIFEITTTTCKFKTKISLKLNSKLSLGQNIIISKNTLQSQESSHILPFNHIFFNKLYPISKGSIVYFKDLSFAKKQLQNSQISFVQELENNKFEGDIILLIQKPKTPEKIRFWQNMAGNYSNYSLTIFVDSKDYCSVASFDGFKNQNYHLENWLKKYFDCTFRDLDFENTLVNNLFKKIAFTQNCLATSQDTWQKLAKIYNKIEILSVYVKTEILQKVLENQIDTIIQELENLTII